MVDVVNEHTGWAFHNLAVHQDFGSLSVFRDGLTQGIESIAHLSGGPSVFCQILIVVWVNYGVFAFCQRDFPEGIAVTDAPIQKDE